MFIREIGWPVVREFWNHPDLENSVNLVYTNAFATHQDQPCKTYQGSKNLKGILEAQETISTISQAIIFFNQY
jgi:hypothetical protein